MIQNIFVTLQHIYYFNKMKKEVIINEACLAELQTNSHRLEGSLGFEWTGEKMELTFHQYQQGSRIKHHPQTLLVLPHGSLRKTPRRYQLRLSINDDLGEVRAAEELKRDSEEARRFLRHLSDVLNFV